MAPTHTLTPTLLEPHRDSAVADFRDDVLTGLRRRQKQIPCKYLYDDRGAQLFEQICDLQEYYPTRTELAIMRQFAPEMAAQIGPGVMLVEYGSGSSRKTRILLDHLQQPAAYVPVDISGEHLEMSARELASEFPHIEVLPVCADFTRPFALPEPTIRPTHAAVYFPGSTIGNFSASEASQLLSQIVPLCGSGGGLLIGIDLRKDPAVLEAAYNDSRGITAQFNLNLLRRINRELNADFDLQAFRHVAEYNDREGRVELYLESLLDQPVSIAGQEFRFAAGERIHTENSHKYTVSGFRKMAAEAGLSLHRYWTDARQLFAVLHLVVADKDRK